MKSYIAKLLLGAYLFILSICVFLPRAETNTSQLKHPEKISSNPISTLGHQIIYLDGSLAWVGNVLMLMPLVILLKLNFARLRNISLLGICIFTSLFIEVSQLFIPGRVSDFLDFAANVTGALIFIQKVKDLKISTK